MTQSQKTLRALLLPPPPRKTYVRRRGYVVKSTVFSFIALPFAIIGSVGAHEATGLSLAYLFGVNAPATIVDLTPTGKGRYRLAYELTVNDKSIHGVREVDTLELGPQDSIDVRVLRSFPGWGDSLTKDSTAAMLATAWFMVAFWMLITLPLFVGPWLKVYREWRLAVYGVEDNGMIVERRSRVSLSKSHRVVFMHQDRLHSMTVKYSDFERARSGTRVVVLVDDTSRNRAIIYEFGCFGVAGAA